MADFTDEQIDLLNAVYKLAHEIEQTRDPDKSAEYVDELGKLKAKLFGLETAKKAAGGS